MSRIRRNCPPYSEVYGFVHLFKAFRKARRAKRGKGGEPLFYRDLESNLLELSEQLQHRTYIPDPYRYFTIGRPKLRRVSEASFRDRVVHHSLVAAMEPVFEKHFISNSYACRKGKGTHAALKKAKHLSRHFSYFLRLDYRSYFEHVRHAKLLELLECKIDDSGILWLCRALLSNILLPSSSCKAAQGLPIGNLTSQFWANVYLDPIDHWVKRNIEG